MRILIVEDEKKIRTFLKKSLEAECYAVDAAENGAAGLSLATLNPYDLVILDNVMPKKTGLEVCTELRARSFTSPILLLSVQSDTAIKVQALNAGADDYLTKPFSLAELLARVRALLRRPQILEQEILKYKDLLLDTKKHLVTLHDQDITLTRKEFMLLAYLMQNQGEVLSRGMIMEHVWDINGDPFSNTIETHIASLRRKINDSETNNYISTISGRGYRFGHTQNSSGYQVEET
jgi:DNA-binding response OmpR family regulator